MLVGEGDDISFNYESQINGSIVQFNYIFGSKLVLVNAYTKYLLHSHCVKLPFTN